MSAAAAVSPPTTVIDCHVAELRKRVFDTLEQWLAASPHHTYVGRAVRHVSGTFNSEWGNPFKHDVASAVCSRYEQHIRARLVKDAVLRQRLVALRG